MPKLLFGEPAPFFQAPSPSNPRFNFDTVAGRPAFLVFLGSPAGEAARRLVAEVVALRAAFDDHTLMLFYVVSDPEDLTRLGVEQIVPGIRYFMDYDRSIAARFGLVPTTSDGEPISTSGPVESGVVALDRALRCLQTLVVTDQAIRPVIGPTARRPAAPWSSSARCCTRRCR